MTNGEKMQEVFPEGKTRRCRDGVVFESDGWCHAYHSDWWNAEYKEPTTKNDSSGLDKNSKKLEKDFGESRRMTREEAKKIFFELLLFGKAPCKKEELEDLCKIVLSALEQEPVLDKVRAEITTLQNRCYALTKGAMCSFCKYECEYKAESEG